MIPQAIAPTTPAPAFASPAAAERPVVHSPRSDWRKCACHSCSQYRVWGLTV